MYPPILVIMQDKLTLSSYSGSAELAAVGVSGAVFNLVSKLFNVPLLNVTTSFVAEEQAAVNMAAGDGSQTAEGTTFMSAFILHLQLLGYKLAKNFHLLTFFFSPFFLGLFILSPAGQQNKLFLPSVSNAVMLAAALGVVEAVALSAGSNILMNTMGIPVVCICLAN